MGFFFRYPFALRADIRQFFPSIDHDILKATFRRLIKDHPLLALLVTIVNRSNPQDEANDYFLGDDLLTPFERRRGLPIGSLTSQWFANWYLNGFDHAVTSGLGFGWYARYCDDYVIFGADRQQLVDLRQRVDERLAGLRLRVHPGKTAVVPTRAGITFVGYRTWAHQREVRGANIRLLIKRLRELRKLFDSGTLTIEDVRTRVMAKRWPFTELNNNDNLITILFSL